MRYEYCRWDESAPGIRPSRKRLEFDEDLGSDVILAEETLHHASHDAKILEATTQTWSLAEIEWLYRTTRALLLKLNTPLDDEEGMLGDENKEKESSLKSNFGSCPEQLNLFDD